MDCPSLQEWLNGEQDGHESAALAHAAQCEDCSRSLSLVAEMLTSLSQAALPPVPARALRRARKIPSRSRRKTKRTHLAEPAQGVDAAPALAIRGGGRSTHRLYRAGLFEIDLAWLDNGSLVGQVVPVDEAPLGPGTCTLLGAGRPVLADLDEQGMCRFTAVGDAHSLVIEVGDERLLIRELGG